MEAFKLFFCSGKKKKKGSSKEKQEQSSNISNFNLKPGTYLLTCLQPSHARFDTC